MELKPDMFTNDFVKEGAFNRTFMELKPQDTHTSTSTDCPFNRTFMELKHKKYDYKTDPPTLLIAPLWN